MCKRDSGDAALAIDFARYGNLGPCWLAISRTMERPRVAPATVFGGAPWPAL